jgi:hypothetical protein
VTGFLTIRERYGKRQYEGAAGPNPGQQRTIAGGVATDNQADMQFSHPLTEPEQLGLKRANLVLEPGLNMTNGASSCGFDFPDKEKPCFQSDGNVAYGLLTIDDDARKVPLRT